MNGCTIRAFGFLSIAISLAGCGVDLDTYDPAISQEEILISSAKNWNDSTLEGNPQDAYHLLSPRCMNMISEQDFPAMFKDFGVGVPVRALSLYASKMITGT